MQSPNKRPGLSFYVPRFNRPFISYNMLMDEIATYPDLRQKRAVAAVDAVIDHGGAARGCNNWQAYWDEAGCFNLYYQTETFPRYARSRAARACRCKIDYVPGCVSDWDNLCLMVFYDWKFEPCESYGLF